jgi:hypothetical protein
MDQLDCPSRELWTQRREWFEQLFDVEKYPGAGFLVGEQATGLLVDLQAKKAIDLMVNGSIAHFLPPQ